MLKRIRPRILTLALGVALALSACGFDRGERWLKGAEPPPSCSLGTARCSGAIVQRCIDAIGGPTYKTEDDCGARGQVCNPDGFSCTPCLPGAGSCDGLDAYRCDADGQKRVLRQSCDPANLEGCREGKCVNLCAEARRNRSNVGCEYWPVDLDNAFLSDTQNAAAQQFAVVVSNPDPDVTAQVVIEQDDSQPGQKPKVVEVARANIPPFSLRVFKLGPREVDGSADGTFNTGTHTALTRHAYRVKTNFPVVAYQFNPLENVNVFSNDASLLKPVEALDPGGSGEGVMYAVLGWPQTIASSDDPDTNFSTNGPTDLRAFLTLVGTRDGTHVTVKTATRIMGGGVIPETEAGGELKLTLDAFDVANLETDGFNSDFTGSIVSADAAVVAFSGSEASDAPFFKTLSDRQCCADHLEEQLDHVRTSGQRFVATVSPNRAVAINAAGGKIGEQDQFEYFRVIATSDRPTHVTTTLSGAQHDATLNGLGDFIDLSSSHHFVIESDAPVALASVSPSQQDANIPNSLPGGDPSLLIVPPIEQFRSSYVFLTPDKYSFDFVRIIAPRGADVALDGQLVAGLASCPAAAADGLTDDERGGPAPLVVYSCQLSFPTIDMSKPRPDNLTAGQQNDGVHRILANQPVGVIVDGFDYFVSYGYAAGTELSFIVPL
ncbi:MAG TPA: IgGFc-binding protein [Polyangiaceae bacterium]|nr:IgGFc-binding protein [Polyangiaceae bacterium]